MIFLTVGGDDYDNATLTTTFIAGTTVATVSIPIADDTVVDEEPEAFTLSFYLIPTTGVRVDPGTRSTATGIIMDTSTYVNLPYKLVREANKGIDNAVLSSNLWNMNIWISEVLPHLHT